jgi:hypothetical protein
VALIVADSRAILGEAAGGAINASRLVGVMVGLLTVVIRALLTRDFGPSRSARSAALGRLALPVAAMIAVSTAPAFTPTDFLETCFWLERVAWPVESELSPTEAAIRQEHRHRIERTLTEIKNRPVSWAVPAGRASGHEVRLVHRYLVNAGWVQAVPDDPNALSLLRRANERMDIAVVLSAGPAENLAVPLTPELLAFGQHFPGQPIPLSATVERIEFEDPESDEHWQGLVRGIFRIHLTGVTTRLGTSH